MNTTRLSSKGQIILPKALRDFHNWQPGTKFFIEEHQEGLLLQPIGHFAASSLDQVAGCLHAKGKAKSIEQMEQAISKGVKRRHDSGRY